MILTFYSLFEQPNEKYGYCTTPKNQPGYCRHLEHCILDDFRNNFVQFLEYICDIPNQNYVGTCCPTPKTDSKHEVSTTTPTPDARDLPPRFPPFNIPFLQRPTTSPPRRRTTNRPRGSSSASRPQARNNNLTCGQAEIMMSRIVGGRPANPKGRLNNFLISYFKFTYFVLAFSNFNVTHAYCVFYKNKYSMAMDDSSVEKIRSNVSQI